LKLVNVWRFLNPFELVNIIESISNRAARHCAGWAGLSVPAAALPRSSLSLLHPSTDTGPLTHLGLAALPCCATTPPPTPDGRGPLLAATCCRLLRLRPPFFLLPLPRGCTRRAPHFSPRCPAPPRCLKSRPPPPNPSFRCFPLDRA
jgi:hypothetical protein